MWAEYAKLKVMIGRYFDFFRCGLHMFHDDKTVQTVLFTGLKYFVLQYHCVPYFDHYSIIIIISL